MPKQFKTARQISHHGRPLACPYRKSRYSAGSSPRTFQNSGKSPTCFAAGTHMLRQRTVLDHNRPVLRGIQTKQQIDKRGFPEPSNTISEFARPHSSPYSSFSTFSRSKKSFIYRTSPANCAAPENSFAAVFRKLPQVFSTSRNTPMPISG